MSFEYARSDDASNSKFSKHSASVDKTSLNAKNVKRHHKGSRLLFTDSGDTWASSSSVSMSESSDTGTISRSSSRWHRNASGKTSSSSSSTSTHYSITSRPKGGHVHGLTASVGTSSSDRAPIVVKKDAHKGKKSKGKKGHHKGKKAKVVKGKKKVEKGFFDLFTRNTTIVEANETPVGIEFAPPQVFCQTNDCDLCCGSQIQGCLPAELHFNGEIFGDLNVSGIAMLYLNHSRIHGYVAAPNADLVVADRTRFDNTVTVHYYGYVNASEIVGGMVVTDAQLWDWLSLGESCTKDTGPGCNSVFLTGFFNTFFCGNFTGPPYAEFLYDPVTGCQFTNNDGMVLGGATAVPLVTFCVDPSTCPPTVTTCVPGTGCTAGGCPPVSECTGCAPCTAGV
jgi:hypothetical protein